MRDTLGHHCSLIVHFFNLHLQGGLLPLLLLDLIDRLSLLDRTDIVLLREVNDKLVLSLDYGAVVLDFQLSVSPTFIEVYELLLPSLVQKLVLLSELSDFRFFDFRQIAQFFYFFLRRPRLALVIAHHTHEAVD